MEPKKLPMRTCIACREEKPKRELLRVVRTPEGNVVFDTTGKLSGRGAYVCPNADCIQKLGRKKLLNRAFSVPLGDDVYQRLEEEFLGRK